MKKLKEKIVKILLNAGASIELQTKHDSNTNKHEWNEIKPIINKQNRQIKQT